jgi:hypothetical protein
MNLQESNGNDNICLPRKTFVEMIETFNKMESLMATMEILADKKTMKDLEESKKDLAEGRFVEGEAEDLDKFMKTKSP